MMLLRTLRENEFRRQRLEAGCDDQEFAQLVQAQYGVCGLCRHPAYSLRRDELVLVLMGPTRVLLCHTCASGYAGRLPARREYVLRVPAKA